MVASRAIENFPIGKKALKKGVLAAELTEREDFGLSPTVDRHIFPIGKMANTPINTADEFGAALARARKGLELTQRELALAIGVGERFIVDLEAGKPTAQLGKALAAAKAAGMRIVDVNELVIERRTP
jgi:DNA-binding XRE family transcriptional regulator